MIIAANKGSDVPTEEAKRLTAMMKGSIADLQAVRDKLYGTYGAAADPSRWDLRLIRMAKQFSNVTLLGMSGVSSLGDMIRPLMTEGLDAMYGYGLRSLMADTRGTILRMAKTDLEDAGVAMDLMQGMSRMTAQETGEVFGYQGKFERGLSNLNNWMFVANGLSQITEWSKTWASVIIQGRMNSAILDFGGAGYKFVDPAMLPRLAQLGIDEPMARRIYMQLQVYGKDFDNGSKTITLANVGQWSDRLAAETYKSALNQSVNRTVVTPGLGDTPNWMSTELGGLLSQYKSFAVANITRSLYSGLQEGGNKFWYGAAGAVGFAILLNEIKSRLFYDRSTFDQPPTGVIVDGIDRSGLLGWFSDANRAVETLTGNRIGAKPLLGAVGAAGDLGPAGCRPGRTIGPAGLPGLQRVLKHLPARPSDVADLRQHASPDPRPEPALSRPGGLRITSSLTAISAVPWRTARQAA